MNNSVKQFIESHIELLETPSTYDDFFDEVYDRLTFGSARELLDILRPVDKTIKEAAENNILKKFSYILTEIWFPYHGEDVPLNLRYFYRRYMSNTCGLTADEFEHLIVEYMNKNYPHINVEVTLY